MAEFELDNPQVYAEVAAELPETPGDAVGGPGDDAAQEQGQRQPSQDDNLSAIQASAAWMPETTLDVRYDYNPGVVVQHDNGDGDPLNGTPRPGRVVKLHDGYWTKVIQWSFERLLVPPVCPHPITGNPNEVLTKATITSAKPLEGPDGLRVWRVSGLYEYVLLVPLDQVGPFPTAISPESTAQMSDNVLPVIAFDRSLLASLGHQGGA